MTKNPDPPLMGNSGGNTNQRWAGEFEQFGLEAYMGGQDWFKINQIETHGLSIFLNRIKAPLCSNRIEWNQFHYAFFFFFLAQKNWQFNW